MDITFLTLAQVLQLHRSSIEKYGGDPSVRDIGLLESAIAQPMASFGGAYLHSDLPAMAAAYLFHIVSNHPFVDGSRRTGAFAAFVFLELNDLPLTAPEKEFEKITLAVANGKASKDEVIEFFYTHTG